MVMLISKQAQWISILFLYFQYSLCFPLKSFSKLHIQTLINQNSVAVENKPCLLFGTSSIHSLRSKSLRLYRRKDRTEIILRQSQPINIPSSQLDLLKERVESFKFGITSVVGGIVTSLPIAIFNGILSKFSGQWEFNEDMLSIMLLVYGLTYRYATRGTTNDQIKQGVAISFILTRTLGSIHVSSTCSSVPLDCGPPFHYFSANMLASGTITGLESYLAFTGASYLVETLIKKGILSSTVRA